MNFSKKKNINPKYLFTGLLLIIVLQSVFLIKFYLQKEDKTYAVNLVKINTEKDSVDYLKMKTNLGTIDQSITSISRFLTSKNIATDKIISLDKDSLASAIYLAKQSNRYSQYLVDLQEKLREVPLGMPTVGYISSPFGLRKNPIPPKVTDIPDNETKNLPKNTSKIAAPAPAIVSTETTPVEPPKQVEKMIELTDSYGNKREVKVMVTPKVASVSTNPKSAVSTNTSPLTTKKNPTKPAVPMQFHKGLDIAVVYGSDVVATAAGVVIFSGQKSGYGNCVIVSHANGLATLYAHLSQCIAKPNQKVKVGQVIAKSGNSGRSTGPHLHYEVHKNNTPINPKLFLSL